MVKVRGNGVNSIFHAASFISRGSHHSPAGRTSLSRPSQFVNVLWSCMKRHCRTHASRETLEPSLQRGWQTWIQTARPSNLSSQQTDSGSRKETSGTSHQGQDEHHTHRCPLGNWFTKYPRHHLSYLLRISELHSCPSLHLPRGGSGSRYAKSM